MSCQWKLHNQIQIADETCDVNITVSNTFTVKKEQPDAVLVCFHWSENGCIDKMWIFDWFVRTYSGAFLAEPSTKLCDFSLQLVFFIFYLHICECGLMF